MPHQKLNARNSREIGTRNQGKIHRCGLMFPKIQKTRRRSSQTCIGSRRCVADVVQSASGLRWRVGGGGGGGAQQDDSFNQAFNMLNTIDTVDQWSQFSCWFDHLGVGMTRIWRSKAEAHSSWDGGGVWKSRKGKVNRKKCVKSHRKSQNRKL